MRPLAPLVAAALVPLALACGGDDDPAGPAGPALFEVAVQDDTFTVRADDEAAIDALEARLESGEEGVINGELASGDGGFNAPWSWHMVPGTIEVPDQAIEVCDGTPTMVEQDLDYWIDTVGRFCPWSAEVVRRLE